MGFAMIGGGVLVMAAILVTWGSRVHGLWIILGGPGDPCFKHPGLSTHWGAKYMDSAMIGGGVLVMAAILVTWGPRVLNAWIFNHFGGAR